jgi:hypothetical protein
LNPINKHNGSSGFPWHNGGTTYPFILHKKMSTFMAVYGYHPPSITSLLRGKAKVQVVEDHIEHQQEVLKLLKENLVREKYMMKQ